MKKESYQVLIVDDDLDYTYLIEKALQGCKSCPTTKAFQTADDLFRWLAPNLTPDLILLDVNMPFVDGFDVLKMLKEADRLKSIPVVMLTVSENRYDVIRSYNYGVNEYITKPVSFEELQRRMEVLSPYWIRGNQSTFGVSWVG